MLPYDQVIIQEIPLNMGEAKRRKLLGLPPKQNNTKSKSDESPRIFDWLPLTINQRDSLMKLSIKASWYGICLLYTSPSPRDLSTSRMPSSA